MAAVAPGTRLEFVLLPGAERVVPFHRAAGQQPDNLCGPYWISTLLLAAGVDRTPPGGLSPEMAARSARTLVPAEGDPRSWVPRGETPRPDYRLPIPSTSDPSTSGTSVDGMIAAVEELSAGTHRFLPLSGVRAGGFDAAAVESLVELLLARPSWEAVPVLNVRTRPLWGTRLRLADALAYLAGEEIAPPEAEWDVGHFLTIAGILRGARRSLLVLRDTYPSFGWDGHHLQPPEAVAAALRRDDGRSGGCLLFVRSSDVAEAERDLRQRGFDVNPWDNGTPYEQGGSM